MKKTIICNIPMKAHLDATVYTSADQSVASSDMAVYYPINAMLKATAQKGDQYKVVLLMKHDEYSFAQQNADLFEEELKQALKDSGATYRLAKIDTEFSEEKAVHEKLMGMIVDELDDGAHIIADITYGSKDMPIVVFSALNFASNFLDCTIDHIVYGQADFKDNKAVNTRLCDMTPLYYLGSVTNHIECDTAERARQMLKVLLSL